MGENIPKVIITVIKAIQQVLEAVATQPSEPAGPKIRVQKNWKEGGGKTAGVSVIVTKIKTA